MILMEQIMKSQQQEKNNRETSYLVQFTNKEIDLIILLGEGATNSEIANQLIISIKEVEELTSGLLIKTRTRNTAHLMKFAAANRIIEI